MAQRFFDWLANEKDRHKILGLGLDFLYNFVFGFIILALFSQIYHFIYRKSPQNPPPNSIESNSNNFNFNWDNIKSNLCTFFSPLLNFFYATFSYISKFISWVIHNPYRILMLIILTLFFVGFYYFRKLYDYSNFLKKYSSYTSGVFIILGTLLTIGVFGLFSSDEGEVKIIDAPKEKYITYSFAERFHWSLHNAMGYYKELSIISIAILCSLLILWVSIKYTPPILPLIAGVIGIVYLVIKLFYIYKSRKGHRNKERATPETPDDESIYPTQSIWFKALLGVYKIYDVIKDFFIKIFNSFCGTNYYIRLLLLFEIIGILLYFVVPLIIKYIYTNNVFKQDGILDTQVDLGIDKAIIENENLLSYLKNGISVDWDIIFSKGLYKESKKEDLEKYLLSIGYKKKQHVKNKLINRMIGRIMNIETAITYVQVNGPLIIELKNKIAHQKTSKWETKEARKKENNIGKTKILLEKPIFIDTLKTIGTYKDIGDSIGTFNYNYSVSSWFFIHNEPPSLRHANTKFTSILNYSDRPNILFNVKTNTLRITMRNTIDQEKIIYETDKIRLQRWNNIITNINSGNIDIFINGKLVSSTTNPIPLMSYDKITAGENDGISGGLCNVTYYPAPLSLAKIKLLYKSLKWKNPPII